VPQAPPKLRCPRNGTVDEAGFSIEPGFNSGAHATEGSRLREGRRSRFASPDTGQQGSVASCLAHVACARGEVVCVPLSGPSVMFHLLRNAPCAPKAPRRSFLSGILLSFGAAAQTELDPVVATVAREPQPLSRSGAATLFNDARTIRSTTADSLENLLRREAGVQLVRNGGPGDWQHVALDHRVEPLRDCQGLGRQAWLGVRFDGRGF
jgi:hypothetical protein